MISELPGMLTTKWLIGAFLLTLFIFHLLVFAWPRTARFWTWVDYIWLGVAFFGLLATANSSQGAWWGQQVGFHEQRLQLVRSDAISSAQLAFNFLNGRANDSRYGDKMREDFSNARSWCEEARRAFETSSATKDWLEYLSIGSALGAIKDREFAPEIRVEILEQADFIALAAQRLADTEAVVERIGAASNPEHLSVRAFFGPTLLAIALGIRIAKVTATLRGFKDPE